ncbi:MAG TPA: hypothetical protein VLI93_13160, partial [Acetobacteraceae bacterium]|nr:hypothetical protein [Acetobacteraceae bacterium]
MRSFDDASGKAAGAIELGHSGASVPSSAHAVPAEAQPIAAPLAQPDAATVQNQPAPITAPSAPAQRETHEAAPSARAPAAQVAPVL